MKIAVDMLFETASSSGEGGRGGLTQIIRLVVVAKVNEDYFVRALIIIIQA